MTEARGAWDRFWFGEASLVRLAAFRIVVLLAAAWSVGQMRFGVLQHADGLEVSFASRPWRPIYVFRVLGLEPPGPVFARAVLAILCASLALGIVGLFTRTACAVSAVLVCWWLGVAYSFGKPHHDNVQLVFALFALPLAPVGARLSLESALLRGQGGVPRETAPWAALPLRFTQISLALGYFFAGASKLWISGMGWMNGTTLQALMFESRSAWSVLLSRHVFLCQLMQIGLIAVQAAFPLALFFPRLRWFFVPGVVAFHWIAMQTIGTHAFIGLWFLLAAFVPLERVPDFLRRHLLAGAVPLRAALAVLLCGLLWITARLYFQVQPAWAPLVALVLVIGWLIGARFAPRPAPPGPGRSGPPPTGT